MSVFLQLKQVVIIAGVVSIMLLTACGIFRPYYYETSREQLYIVQSQHTPTLIIPYGVSSTAEGTVDGVFNGMGACVAGGAQTGNPIGLILGILLSPVCGVVGGAHGGLTADREIYAKKEGGNLGDWVNGKQIQDYFTQAIIDYAEQQGLSHTVIDSKNNKAIDKEKIQTIEVMIDNIEIKRTVKAKEPDNDTLCVIFRFRGLTGKDAFGFPYKLGCKNVGEWREEGRVDLQKNVEHLLKQAAEYIIDDKYLIYRPVVDKNNPLLKQRVLISEYVPDYALAAIYPKMTMSEEISGLSQYKTGKINSLSQFYVPEVNEVPIHLSWESFPFPWDKALDHNIHITDVLYDLRIYKANFFKGEGLFAISQYNMGKLVYEKNSLRETEHDVGIELEPCSAYYWTVRSRFKLDDVPRMTEWGGEYRYQDSYFEFVNITKRWQEPFYFMFKVSPIDMQCEKQIASKSLG